MPLATLTLLLGGRLGDLYGRRRVFTVGLVVFAVASLLTVLALVTLAVKKYVEWKAEAP